MFAAGFVEEVARLQARGDLHADLPALRAVGYRQVWACLEGRLDEALLFQSVLQATRQFAKRQLTALRPLPGIMALQAEDRAARAQAVDYFAAVLDQSDKRG